MYKLTNKNRFFFFFYNNKLYVSSFFFIKNIEDGNKKEK